MMMGICSLKLSRAKLYFLVFVFLLANYTRGIKKLKKLNKYAGGMSSMVDWVKIDVLQKG